MGFAAICRAQTSNCARCKASSASPTSARTSRPAGPRTTAGPGPSFSRSSPPTRWSYKASRSGKGRASASIDPGSGRLVQLWLRQIEHQRRLPQLHLRPHVARPGPHMERAGPASVRGGRCVRPEQPAEPGLPGSQRRLPGQQHPRALRRHTGGLPRPRQRARRPEERLPAVAHGLGLLPGPWDARQKAIPLDGRRRASRLLPEVSARGLMEPEVAELQGRPAAGGLARLDPGLGRHSGQDSRAQVLQPIHRRRADAQPSRRMEIR